MPSQAEISSLFGFGAALLTLAYIGSAIAVTLHVLKHKREVGTAMAWIGVAWLSPFFGAALYAGFGINRVKRRARRLRGRRPTDRAASRRLKPLPEYLEPLDRA